MSKAAEIERQDAARREYLREWEKLTPEQREEMRAAGITGPDAPAGREPKAPVVDKEPDNGPTEASYPDSAPEEFFADAFLDARRDGFDDVEAARRAYLICSHHWEINKYSHAARIVLLVLQLLTRSKWWGLRRAAETLVLAVAGKLADEDSQAALGRKYGVTRAAINKDVSLIKRDNSFGALTEFFYKAAGKHKIRSDSATAAHKKDKELRAAPPENSLVGGLLKRLAA